MTFSGNIDVFGYLPSLLGFLAVGWIDLAWDDPNEDVEAIIEGDLTSAAGKLIISLFPRQDVSKVGVGFVMLIQSSQSQIGRLLKININYGDKKFELIPSVSLSSESGNKIIMEAKNCLNIAIPNSGRARLRKILERPIYLGVETISESTSGVRFEIDRVYFCPPDGFVFVGWYLDFFSEVAEIRVRCGGRVCSLDRRSWISVMRSDVVEGFKGKFDISDPRLGFITYLSEIYLPNENLYAEIELRDGRCAFRPIQPEFLCGLSSIRDLLAGIKFRADEIISSFEHVVGPAIEKMNDHRLGRQLGRQIETTILQYGEPHECPRSTIIVPLYGRIDFMEYQMAFFFNCLADDHEIIYVLDDPDRREETEALAASCFARFERPFALMPLDQNVGYAPANNVGLRHARGHHICFLNSDVFPGDPDWLEYLIATEKSDDTIGIVGALLVYEDETLQHRGCEFERIPELGNLRFVTHPDKGRRVALSQPRGSSAISVTGACMLMQRDLALRLGGFDEGYIVGDFEDVDLCLRARELGFSCAVDYRARLYHLERQSQGQSQPWRLNLTLYNAWRFDNRWKSYEF